jgi:hypothetical protein
MRRIAFGPREGEEFVLVPALTHKRHKAILRVMQASQGGDG